jgi:hypothetical protein
MHSKIHSRLTKDLTNFKQSPLKNDSDFESLKERFLIVHSMLQAHNKATEVKKKHAVDMIFTSADLKSIEKTLEREGSRFTFTNAVSTVKSWVISPTGEDRRWRYELVKSEMRRWSQREFLTELPTMVANELLLAGAAEEINEYFIQKLRERVNTLATNLANFVSEAERNAFEQHKHLEAAIRANEAQSKSRAELLEDLRKAVVKNEISK